MVCEECFGTLVLALVSVVIGLFLLYKYSKEKNNFTLYMVLFFLFAGIAWLVLIISKDWALGIYDSIIQVLILLGFLPQLMLLIFILTFLDYSAIIRILTVTVSLLLIIIHIFIPQYRIMTIVSAIIIVSNIVLFILNWRKNNDIKSLGFAIGLMFILIGESLLFLSRLLQGILLLIAAVIWALTYSGLLERIISK